MHQQVSKICTLKLLPLTLAYLSHVVLMGNGKYGKPLPLNGSTFSMGKSSPHKKDLLGYIREGWYFRTKTVKGRRYITRRKGEKERGMGPFDPDLWAMINMLVQQTAEEEESVLEKGTVNLPRRTTHLDSGAREFNMKFGRLFEHISMYRGIEMMQTCIHLDEEGYCTYWNWEKKPNFLGLLDELLGSECYEKRRISKKGLSVDRWMVKAFQWYCSSCPVYQTLKE